eukprot:1247167-Pyramimonas_sp.AAC.1
MSSQTYALKHPAYKPPPDTREAKQYKHTVEDRMTSLTDLLLQGRKALFIYMAAPEHELSVPKWMHWQLEPLP